MIAGQLGAAQTEERMQPPPPPAGPSGDAARCRTACRRPWLPLSGRITDQDTRMRIRQAVRQAGTHTTGRRSVGAMLLAPHARLVVRPRRPQQRAADVAKVAGAGPAFHVVVVGHLVVELCRAEWGRRRQVESSGRRAQQVAARRPTSHARPPLATAHLAALGAEAAAARAPLPRRRLAQKIVAHACWWGGVSLCEGWLRGRRRAEPCKADRLDGSRQERAAESPPAAATRAAACISSHCASHLRA